jgi:hypothetical protein
LISEIACIATLIALMPIVDAALRRADGPSEIESANELSLS